MIKETLFIRKYASAKFNHWFIRMKVKRPWYLY